MRNIRLTLEYNGTYFSGWQIQPGKRTVQQTLQDVLQKITGEEVVVTGASRTDAGVHALGQVANFHLKSSVSCLKILASLRGLLPEDVSVKKIDEVPLNFQSNRHAKKKTYTYLIWNHPNPSVFLHGCAAHVYKVLNLKAMQQSARFLVGRHDFSAFRGAKSDTVTSVRTIYEIKICRSEVASPLQITITGNGFLKYMVRNIVGTLIEIGQGKRPALDMKKILQSRDRRQAGSTAPACGLYLQKVFYT